MKTFIKISVICIFILIIGYIYYSRKYSGSVNDDNKVFDSIQNCNFVRMEIIEQAKRGNYFVFGDYTDYCHATQYLKDSFNLSLFPSVKKRFCAEVLSNYYIRRKFGSDFYNKIETELKEKYKNIESYKSIDGYYYYAETYPEYDGDYHNLCDFLYKHVRTNIQTNLCDNIDTLFGALMIVDIFIDQNGKINNAKIFQKLCPIMDKLVVESIKNLKIKIKPATHKGMNVPFTFQLYFDWRKSKNIL